MIKFLQLNLDGYIHKEPLLTQIINNHQIDVLIISELKRSHYYDDSKTTLQLPGFTTHQRSFRTAILYRENFQHQISPFF